MDYSTDEGAKALVNSRVRHAAMVSMESK